MSDFGKGILVGVLVLLVLFLGSKWLINDIMVSSSERAAKIEKYQKERAARKEARKQKYSKRPKKASPRTCPVPNESTVPKEQEDIETEGPAPKNQPKTRSLYHWNSICGGGIRMILLEDNTRLLTVRDLHGNDYNANLGVMEPKDATRIFTLTKSRAMLYRLTPDKAEEVLDYAIQTLEKMNSDLVRY